MYAKSEPPYLVSTLYNMVKTIQEMLGRIGKGLFGCKFATMEVEYVNENKL